MRRTIIGGVRRIAETSVLWSSSQSHNVMVLRHNISIGSWGQPVHAYWSKVISIIFCVLPSHLRLDHLYVSSSKAVVDRTWILGGSLQDTNHSKCINVIGTCRRYAWTSSPSTCRPWQPTQLTFHLYTKQLYSCRSLSGIGVNALISVLLTVFNISIASQ